MLWYLHYNNIYLNCAGIVSWDVVYILHSFLRSVYKFHISFIWLYERIHISYRLYIDGNWWKWIFTALCVCYFFFNFDNLFIICKQYRKGILIVLEVFCNIYTIHVLSFLFRISKVVSYFVELCDHLLTSCWLWKSFSKCINFPMSSYVIIFRNCLI